MTPGVDSLDYCPKCGLCDESWNFQSQICSSCSSLAPVDSDRVAGLLAILALGRAMRAHQKRYFQTRDHALLRKSKAMEAEFDRRVVAALMAVKRGDDLFGGP